VYGRDSQVAPQAEALTWDEARRITTIAVTFSPVMPASWRFMASRGPACAARGDVPSVVISLTDDLDGH